MKKKALFAYAILLGIVFPAHALHLPFSDYLIPLYLVAVPLVLEGKININFSLRQILMSLIVSLMVLAPFFAVFLHGKKFAAMGAGTAIFQLLCVSFPEEVFFRGFLQEAFGNNISSVVMVSLLFAGAHLPGLFFYGDVYAPLTFIPSLVMGILYMRTSNVIPPTIFHFLSNVLYLASM
ncbi:putative Abortive infection protein [Candidatus Sulfobium mesophilum]|uniref:Putative Abortive infection protein n=1 Tax=Candidatus Sulfobium mesophilum TaxID=2016548 RepID=A0A2U3QGU6_9BACT|nr:putative Abortive infection protein [Candidatus Sulfobium mesophilum]